MLNGLFSKINSFWEMPKVPNLRDLEENPRIEYDKSNLPENVVVIIGESFAKSHSSLYGYEKNTNPLLSKFVCDSSLFVYENVTSPATHTLEAFSYILNTYKLGHETDTHPESSITLPCIARYMGYKTYWISNQSKHGQNENLVGEYANLCDEEYFVDNKFSGLNRWSKDDEVIPIIKKCLKETTKNNFFFVHLMGSHFKFSSRYPQKYDVFQSNDYKYNILGEKQRKTIAEYDNTVLYNDFVISEIIKLFRNQETVLFYFSDHGFDVYESSDDWCGHAKDNNPLSVKIGTQIPFMLYVSSMYKQRFPQLIKSFSSSISKEFSTDKFIYFVMDILGIRFKDNDDVKKYSILR